MCISQKVKGVIMCNLRGTIIYIKSNVLEDFNICMSVPLNVQHFFGTLSQNKVGYLINEIILL